MPFAVDNAAAFTCAAVIWSVIFSFGAAELEDFEVAVSVLSSSPALASFLTPGVVAFVSRSYCKSSTNFHAAQMCSEALGRVLHACMPYLKWSSTTLALGAAHGSVAQRMALRVVCVLSSRFRHSEHANSWQSNMCVPSCFNVLRASCNHLRQKKNTGRPKKQKKRKLKKKQTDGKTQEEEI